MKRYLAEFFGTMLLLAVITGSGIMGEALSTGNAGIALLGNSIATGAGLFVLITLIAPISGAHFNPIVSIFFFYKKELSINELISYFTVQFTGAIAGVWLTHVMYQLPIIQFSTKNRGGSHLWVSEYVGTLLLLCVIQLGLKYSKDKLPLLISLIVIAGYWFTSSTFFCNPAVTLARSMTNTFVGIEMVNIISFMTAQISALLTFIVIQQFFHPDKTNLLS